MRTIREINEKILCQQAVVWTVEELKTRVRNSSVEQVFKEVDVICTGTFEPMESSGAIINLGHTDPPIKIRQCWIEGIPAYAGFGAVDLYLGSTAMIDYAVTGEGADGD
ncbi:MAG: homocysteine biosynthesis protein, partial [cyanobacterium endosymbiont of Rhopalodia inflata]